MHALLSLKCAGLYLQILQGTATFSGLQDAAFIALERQDPERFSALDLRPAEHRDGRLFSKAFFLSTSITHLCAVGGPGIHYDNVNLADGSHTDGFEDVIASINVGRRTHGVPHRHHGTGRPGCDGITPLTNANHRLWVGDGVEVPHPRLQANESISAAK